MARDTASRKWLITINNPEEHAFTHDIIKSKLDELKGLDYWCMADEIGLEDNTYHTHLFVYSKNAIMFSTLKKRFDVAHLDMGKGSSQEIKDYVAKTGKWLTDKKHDTCVDGTFEEFGECPIERQGRSNKLDDLYSLIKSGLSNYEIMEIDPSYGTYFDKFDIIRQMIICERYKSEWRNLEVTYVYGDTGSGKTRSIMEKFGYENVFRVTDYSHPFDNYKGQEIVIFEEFRSSLKIGDMLNYLDGYPLELPCRYNNKWACYTKVFVISNIPLGKQFTIVQNEDSETFNAFVRRFHNVLQFTSNKIIKSKIDVNKSGFRTIVDGEYNAFDDAIK